MAQQTQINSAKYCNSDTCNLDVLPTKQLNNDSLNLSDNTNTTNLPADTNVNISGSTLKRKPFIMKKKEIPFWGQDPNILFKQHYAFEFFPVETMTYEQKLNAVTRTVLVLTIISFLYTRSTRLLAVSAVTILAIVLLHFAHMQSVQTKMSKYGKDPRLRYTDVEGFGDAGFGGGGFGLNDQQIPKLGPQHNSPYMDPNINKNLMISTPSGPEIFVEPEPQNPFGNVLLTDYDYNPHKKPAPPSYTGPVGDDILKQAKRMVIEANPSNPGIADKLFGDLGDEFVFEQSMQPFYSTANTTIPNDQAGFADFCYGTMVSAKEGNMFALNNNNPGPRFNLY